MVVLGLVELVQGDYVGLDEGMLLLGLAESLLGDGLLLVVDEENSRLVLLLSALSRVVMGPEEVQNLAVCDGRRVESYLGYL